jgi:hypothetical protein
LLLFQIQDDWNILSPMYSATSTSQQRILDRNSQPRGHPQVGCRSGMTFQMQICRSRQRRHRDPRPRLGSCGDAATGGNTAAAVTPPPLHGCSVQDCFGGPCGPLPHQRIHRGWYFFYSKLFCCFVYKVSISSISDTFYL